jgi:hypothetical protein
MIEQLIARVFYARNLAHFEHFRTKSYSQHKALGKFYENVIGSLDALVEAYQGANGIIGNIPVPEDIKNDCLKTLKADAAWIEEHHDDVSMGNRAVGNLLDNVTGIYLSTIYKLENLK